MSYVQLESLVDLREKHGYARYKRTLTVAALLVGTMVLGVLFVGGLSFHHQRLLIDPPGGLGALETSLAVRPDYPVSSFVYERRSFRWFLGASIVAAATGFAIYSLYPACVAATAGVGAVPCTIAALSAAALVAGLIFPPGGGGSSGGGVTSHDIELGDMNELAYVNSFGGNGKRDADQDSHIYKLLRGTLGEDYTFAGHVTGAEERHADLIARNGGQPVPVYSFTSSKGIRFHHAMVIDSATNGVFHRFGFNPGNGTAASKRATDVEPTNEHFSSGGLDVLGCGTSSQDHLVDADVNQMQTELTCNLAMNDIKNAHEIAVQVYDADTMETIGSGLMAPFNSAGKSALSGNPPTSSCPNSQPTKSGCPMETSS